MGGREREKGESKRKREVTSREFNPERILNWQIVLFRPMCIWTESYKNLITFGIVTVLFLPC